MMQPGEVVAGRFAIEVLAASGGMGTVYRARDRNTGALVALKVIGKDGPIERFEQEARLLAELDHPGVVRYIAHGRADGDRPFLVMDWLEGEDLRTRLLRGPLSAAETVALARRVAGALAAAHGRGIVHRDIKPANLFLVGGDTGHVVVLDFGIAQIRLSNAFDTTAAPITRTGAAVGTVGYMSPEQARAGKGVDSRSDVFALGCVLFECLTGRPAFAGANPVAVLARVLLENAPRVRHLAPSAPAVLDELVARMLEKDPAARPRDAAVVLRALETTDGDALCSSSGVSERERRMVTIVLARRLDPGKAVSLGDGQITELAGDATLIEFRGADAVVRAAATALALSSAQPRAEIAIATGRISSASAYGPIIDRVTTLESKPGVVIDDGSASLLGGRFQVEDGALVAPLRPGTAPRRLLGRKTPCVGRDKELALLEATFRESAGEPVSRGLLVTGPPGSGKTRLAHELLVRVREDASIILARGDPVGAGSALGVVRQLLRSAAAIRESDSVEAQRQQLSAHLGRFFSGDVLSRHAEMLGELVGAPSRSPSAALRAARDDARILATWLARSFAEWIAALSDAGPVLCVVEDLHWGDGTSVGYLDEALRQNALRPLMVLALARPEVHELFPELWSRAGAQEIRLSPLTRRAAERLVREVLHGVPDGTVARIVDRADGNAFHLEELIRHVAERGPESAPDTVLALAETRIDRLDAEARRWLRVASVFGETVWADGVSAMLETPCSLDVTQRLVDAELIVPGTQRNFSGEWAFRHSLLREAAYATLTDEDRVALHRRAADWLETAGEVDALVLAEHYERAGEQKLAAPWYLRAATRAVEGGNGRDAVVFAERGVCCGAEGEVLGRLRLLQALFAGTRGDHPAAVRHARQAHELLPRRASEWYLAASILLSSGVYIGELDVVPAIVSEMLSSTPNEPPSAHYGLAIAVSIDILEVVGEYESGERLWARAEAVAQATPDVDRAYLAWLDYKRSSTLLRLDRNLGEALATAARGEEHALASNDATVLAFYRYGRALLEIEVGAHARARSMLAGSAREMEELGAPLASVWSSVHTGWSFLLEARYPDAVTAARRAFDTIEHRHGHALAALAHVLQGELGEAERLSAAALDGIDGEILPAFALSIVRGVAARVALVAGRLDQAKALGDRIYDTPQGTAFPSMSSICDRTRIEIALARGELDDAAALASAAASRIQRHARSLDGDQRKSYLTNHPDHAWILAQAQR